MLFDSDMFVIGQCCLFNKDILLLGVETVKGDHQLKIELTVQTVHHCTNCMSNEEYELTTKMNRVTIVVRCQRG